MMGFASGTGTAPDILQIYEWRLSLGNPVNKMMQLVNFWPIDQ